MYIFTVSLVGIIANYIIKLVSFINGLIEWEIVSLIQQIRYQKVVQTIE